MKIQSLSTQLHGDGKSGKVSGFRKTFLELPSKSNVAVDRDLTRLHTAHPV